MYREIIYKMLCRQKKKFVGIILVYMILISCIVTLGVFDNIEYERNIENTKIVSGDYNYIIKYDKDTDIEGLYKKDFIDSIGFLKYVDSSYGYKYNINVMGFDNNYVSMSNSKLISGRYPKNDGEIVVERWVASILGKDILNKDVSFPLYKLGKEKKYRVVGILSDINSNSTDGIMQVYVGGKRKLNTGDVIFVKSTGRKNANALSRYMNERYPKKESEKPKAMERTVNLMYKEDNTIKFFVMALAGGIVLSLLQYVLMIINARDDEYTYGVFKSIGMDRVGVFFIKLFEQLYAFIPGFILSIILVQPVVNKIINLISETGDVKQLTGYLEPIKIFMIFAISIVSVFATSTITNIRYSKMDSLKMLNREESEISVSRKNERREYKNIENNILFSFIGGYSRKLIVISSVIAISSSLYIFMDYKEKEGSYSLNINFNSISEGMSESIISPIMGSIKDGISKDDVDKIRNIKLQDGKTLSEKVTAGKECYARVNLSNSQISNKKFFDMMMKNDNYTKKVLKGILNKNGDGYTLKLTVFGVDKNRQKMIKEATGKELSSGKAILNIPKYKGKYVLDIKPRDVINVEYPSNGILDGKFISGGDVKLSSADVEISDIISQKVVNTDFYVSGDNPALIVDEDTFTKLFGIENYRNIGIYLSDDEQNNLESSISDVLLPYSGLMIRNYTQERGQIEKSNRITSMISKFASLFFLAIGAINLFSVTVNEYLQKKTYFDTLMCIGMEKKRIRNMILKQSIILSVPISVFTVVVSFLIQLVYYNKFVIEWSLSPRFKVYYGSYIEMAILIFTVSIFTSIYAYRQILSERRI